MFANRVGDRIAGYTVELFAGRSLQDVIEEFAERYLRDGIDQGLADPHILLDNIRQAIASKTMHPRLVAQIADAVGLNATRQEARLQQEMEEQLAAEAMGGFPEVQDALRGKLPHPRTAAKAGHPLAGELRRIWEGLVKPTRRRTKTGRAIDRTNEANDFFLPEGESMDPDLVRRDINQHGFDFDTPADMLSALDVSVSYGKPVYGTASHMGESFSLGVGTTQQQKESVLATAPRGADGHPLAPNGRRSNLTESQWATARTAGFRKWFGDWVGANIARVLTGPVVAELKTQSAPAGGFAELRSWATGIFASQGGKAVSPVLGEVVLNERSVRNSLGHSGANQFKKVAFMAVKSVIEKGVLVHAATNPDNISYYLCAPVEIDGIANVVTVLVHRDVNTQRMYLHSVTTKENLLNPRVSSALQLAGSTETGDVWNILHSALAVNPESVSKEIDSNGEPISAAVEEFGKVAPEAPGESMSLSHKSIIRLEEAIARKMNQGPEERAAYYEKLRDRLASTVLMLRESKRNVAVDQTDAERERNRIRDGLAEAKAIIAALPPEARDRVSFPITDILEADTERGQTNALIRLIDQADAALETVLLKEYRDAFETLLDLAFECYAARELRIKLEIDTNSPLLAAR